ncbi:MAG: type II secretion system protein [Candidatus Margulisiibacteriota bacterium]
MKAKKGITLIELIIAMAISVAILAVLVMAYVAGSKLFNSEMSRSAAFLEANKAVSTLRSDLRSCLELTSANATGISFWADDLNSNGTREANEIYSYSWNGTAGSPLTRTISGSSTMIAKDIKNFLLTYNSGTLASITQVDIKVTAGTAENAATFESSVKLRNL